MNEKNLLDCTLRDGGYINEWCFGADNMREMLAGLVAAGVDFAEIGFLDENAASEPGRSMFASVGAVDDLYKGIDCGDTKLLAMIDYGSFGAGKLPPCSETALSGIRVMFKKQFMGQALQLCTRIRELGYLAFAQPVSVTCYSDSDVATLISIANEARPHAVYVVDTYGLLHQGNLSHYIDMLDEGLHEDIAIGYHGHNNFQMGYANCISVLSRETARELIVDGSLYGMGKSAGNAPTELIAMYMDHRYDKGYDIGRLLESIERCVLPFYDMPQWGYSIYYFLAAANGCHPEYVRFFSDDKKLPVRDVYDILGSLDGERRLRFDEDHAEQKYVDFRREHQR